MYITRIGALALLSSLVGCGAAASPTDAAGSDGGVPIDAARTDDVGTGGGGRSAGCGTASALATGEWVTQTLDASGVTRTYAIYLPDGYDASRAYPIVYQMHGCSDSTTREDNNVPVERESGADAIHVRGRALDRCWDTSATGPDVAFFDTMVSTVEASVCADTTHRFVTGYSGGSFFAHQLACIRGDQLRGVATIAGGQGGGSCEGPVAALLIHDTNDGTVGIAASEGARDAHAMRNGCDSASARTPVDPAPCEAYAGCDPGLPVVWCQTSGQDHSRQDDLAAPAFWGFLSSLD